jgi:glucose-1-phosphate cytidylyltransferase
MMDPMKVAILAGGMGSRMSENGQAKSKALAEIGENPILWHLIKYYQHYGFTESVIALGYMAGAIQSYFENAGYQRLPTNGTGQTQRWRNGALDVTLVDTGPDTENGGRIKRLAPYLSDGTFMLTWCDGLADVDLPRLIEFHRSHGRLATLTAVHPPGRFGRLSMVGDRVSEFSEKTVSEDEWINGAFFVLEPEVFDYIEGDQTQFERDTLARLAREGQLMAYRHRSFWQCMDTMKEQRALDAMWRERAAPWKVWE